MRGDREGSSILQSAIHTHTDTHTRRANAVMEAERLKHQRSLFLSPQLQLRGTGGNGRERLLLGWIGRLMLLCLLSSVSAARETSRELPSQQRLADLDEDGDHGDAVGALGRLGVVGIQILVIMDQLDLRKHEENEQMQKVQPQSAGPLSRQARPVSPWQR